MTVSAATRNDGKRTGPLWSTDGSRKYTDQYTVITSGDDVTGKMVANAPGLPKKNSGHPTDSTAIVTRIDPKQQNATTWFVTITWSTKHGDKERQSDDPIDDPVKLRWERVDLEESRSKDLDGKWYRNILQEALRNPPKFPISRLRLIVEQSTLVFNPTMAKAFGNKVNSDAWFGYAPHEVLLYMPTATEQFKNDVAYWKIVFTFEFNEEKWIPNQILNEGTKYLQPIQPGAFRTFMKAMDDDNGLATGGWGNLKINGDKADRFDVPVLLDFRQYETAVFADLNLL